VESALERSSAAGMLEGRGARAPPASPAPSLSLCDDCKALARWRLPNENPNPTAPIPNSPTGHSNHRSSLVSTIGRAR
jgi:hypothetical protein